MEIKSYVQIYKRWAWLLVLGLLLGALGGYISALYETPVYQASTKLLVSQAPVQGSNIAQMSDQQLAQTYIQLLTTRPVLESAGKMLGYPVGSGQISAQLVRETQLIRVSVTDNDPVQASEIANTLVSVLIEQNDQLQSNRFTASEQSLKAQLDQIENQISTLQQEIASVSEESLRSQQIKVKDEIDNLEKEIIQVQKEISAITPRRSQFSQDIDQYLSPDQTALLQEKELRLDQLNSTLNFYQGIYLNLTATGKPIAGNGSSTGSSLDSNQLNQMQNTLTLYQTMYSNLLSSYESVRLARLQTTPNIVQVEEALPSGSPIRPRPLNNASMGGTASLVLIAAIIFLIEYLDDTVKTPEDIEHLFKLPVIGYIAEVENPQLDNDKVFVSELPRSPVSEAFRSLRTNIEFAGVDKPIRSLLITSANPVEGKSFIAVNLAMVISQGGKRVVLVDSDLRKPRLHRFLNMSNRVGLSDIFLSHRTIQAVTRPWNDTRLSIITSGSIPPNPSELLASEKMGRFLNNLKEVTDTIIIDSPPLLVADPSLLAARVDGVLLVIQPGKTKVDAAKAMVEQLNRVGANILGVVFNRIPRNRSDYYGGYKHYSQYYYKYHGYYAYGENSNGHELTQQNIKHNPMDGPALIDQPSIVYKKNGSNPKDTEKTQPIKIKR